MQLAWKKLSEHAEKVGYRWLIHKQFELPDGNTIDFTTNGSRLNNVAVLALTKENKVVIARQFRAGPEAILDELPGGMADDGEAPEIAARRELAEETGYATLDELEFIGHGCRDAYYNETDNYYIARNCYHATEQQTDPNEFIEVTEITIEELLANAKAGKMSDGIGVLLAYDKLMEVKNGKK